MYSGKTDENIASKSAALPAIRTICENFDKTFGTILCAKKHVHKKDNDIILLLNDLQKLNRLSIRQTHWL